MAQSPRHDRPIHLRLGGYESISTGAWVYAQHPPVVRSQLDGAGVVSQQRGEEQTLRVTRESHPTLHSLHLSRPVRSESFQARGWGSSGAHDIHRVA